MEKEKVHNITIRQGDALDLAVYEAESFDVTMLLGPMYHLYGLEDKRKALAEAIRVTKKGGRILVAYCMNESTFLQFCVKKGYLKEYYRNQKLTKDYKCISEPEDLFEMVRIEDIEEVNRNFPVQREKIVATDGSTNYMKETIDALDEESFSFYLDYHLATCERSDLIGATNHALDILIKK